MGSRLIVGLFSIVALSLTACSSAQKQRQLEREKLVATTGLYCDFINGDEYQDIEVKLNLEIARRCDPAKNYTISSFKNSSDLHGMLYCCSIPKKEETKVVHHEAAKPNDLKADPKLDAKADPKHDKQDDIFSLDDNTKDKLNPPAAKPAAAPAKPAETATAATKSSSGSPSVSSPSAPSAPGTGSPSSPATSSPSSTPAPTAKAATPPSAANNVPTNRAPASASAPKVTPKAQPKAPTDSLFDE